TRGLRHRARRAGLVRSRRRRGTGRAAQGPLVGARRVDPWRLAMTTPRILEGQLSARGLRLALIASRFNGTIVDLLVTGAMDAFVRTGGEAKDAVLVRVPGAFELPQALRRVVERGEVDAIVCLGAVIRGATPHFDVV